MKQAIALDPINECKATYPPLLLNVLQYFPRKARLLLGMV